MHSNMLDQSVEFDYQGSEHSGQDAADNENNAAHDDGRKISDQ